MRTQILSLDLIRGEILNPLGEEATNHSQRQTAAKVLWTAMERELTPRQRECVELCVLRGMSQVEVGKLLGLNKATVCRHMQKAKRSLKKAACYAGMDKLFSEDK